MEVLNFSAFEKGTEGYLNWKGPCVTVLDMKGKFDSLPFNIYDHYVNLPDQVK